MSNVNSNKTVSISHKFKVLCCLSISVLISSCAVTEQEMPQIPILAEQVFERDKIGVEDQITIPLEGLYQEQGKKGEVGLSAASARVKNKPMKFNIAVDGVAAKEFFMGLVVDTPYNMLVHPKVEGEITLSLKNVDLLGILKATRELYGYEFKLLNQGFIVYPLELRTKIFTIDYLNISRGGVSQTRVSSGQKSSTGGNNLSEGSEGRERSSGGTTSGSQIDTENSTNFWSELSESLKAIVGEGEKQKVVMMPQTGLILVTAMPKQLKMVEEYLNETREIIHRQVILEAKILEVQLNDGFQSGVNWGYLAKMGANLATLAQTGGGTAIASGLTGIAGNSGNLNPGSRVSVSGSDVSAFGGVFTAGLEFNDFSVLIELLKKQGTVRTLSSPRVATLNNQKAIIKVGSDEYFVTDVSTTTVTGTSTTTNPDITLTPFFSGIALDVTPQISEHDKVTLHIHPSIIQVKDQLKTITVGNQDQRLPLAFSTVRESDSIIYARSGQVVVIGGLMLSEEEDANAGTPILKDIPYLGSLFKHKKLATRKNELVILLKPTVIDEVNGWGKVIDQTQQRFESFYQKHEAQANVNKQL